MSVEASIAELRARLQLSGGDTPTLLLAVAQSDAVLDETRRLLFEILRATPLEIVDLGPCKSDMGPSRWAELTKEHAEAAAFVLTFLPSSALAVTGFARRLNAERQWLRELAGPLVLVVSRTTEHALRQHAQDFFTWVAHSYEFPEPKEIVEVASRLGVAPEAVTPTLPPEPPVRFLHISDLHLRRQLDRRYDQDRVLDGLLSFLERDRPDYPLDLIFVTGDLAHAGKPEEYALVVELFEQLMARTGVPAERIFVVPGNHDIDRGVGRWLLRTLSTDEQATAFFEDPRSRGFHAQKLAAYQASMRGLLGAARPLGLGVGEDSVEIVEVRGARIAVAMFNSAWFAQGDDDREKLWVGEANVMRAVDKIADEEAPFAIAMLHHPFEDLHPLDREGVEPWLERGFDLVLRGHLHANKTRSIMSQRGGFVEVAAPAAYQGSKWGNGCFLGEIRVGARTVKLRPYMYTSGPDPWVLDTRVFPDDETDGYSHTFAVPAKTRLKSAVGRPLRAATADAIRSLSAERRQEVMRDASGNGSTASRLSAADVLGVSSESWRSIVGTEDPGIAWVSAISHHGEAIAAAGEGVSVTDLATLVEALERAGRLFLHQAGLQKISQRVYASMAKAAFAAAFAAVAGVSLERGTRTAGREAGLMWVVGKQLSFFIAFMELSPAERTQRGRGSRERLHNKLRRASFDDLRPSSMAVGVFVLLGGPPTADQDPRVSQVKDADGMSLLTLEL